jgi:hypothetical protein
MLDQLLFKSSPDTIRLLKSGVLTDEELYALVLEIIIHNALVVPHNSDTPLLQLSDDSLSALLCNSGNIAFGTSILETQAVTIPYKDISNGVKDGSRWRACKN